MVILSFLKINKKSHIGDFKYYLQNITELHYMMFPKLSCIDSGVQIYIIILAYHACSCIDTQMHANF